MSPTPILSAQGKEAIDALLSETVEKRQVPAVHFGACTADEILYYDQGGQVKFGDDSQGLVDEDTTTELFSQTKLFTSVAVMQLVEQGKVSLDSEEDIEKWLPEIGQLKVLAGDGETLVEPVHKVTLRMLLSHTSGFVLANLDAQLTKWLAKHPKPSQFDPSADLSVFCTPLVYQPGTSWAYGTSLDWAGILVERISGQRLEEYFKEHLFRPCGITSLTFLPTDDIKKHKQWMCVRDAEGNVIGTEDGFGMGRPTNADQIPIHSGGAGLFGTQRDALKFLQGILRCGTGTGENSSQHPRLLSKASYDELFRSSLPTSTPTGERYDGRTRIAEMVGRGKWWNPDATSETVDHSVGGVLNLVDLVDRRKKGSLTWSGAAKTQWWIDPVTGIAGICGTQLLAPSPDPWFGVYVEFEKRLYAGLQ